MQELFNKHEELCLLYKDLIECSTSERHPIVATYQQEPLLSFLEKIVHETSLYCPSIEDKTSETVIQFFKKAIDDGNKVLLQEALYRNSFVLTLHVFLAFKKTNTFSLLEDILDSSSASNTHYKRFMEVAIMCSYTALFDKLIETKGADYLKDHAPFLIEKTLEYQWLEKTIILVETTHKTEQIQCILDKYLSIYTKKGSLAGAHILLMLGAKVSSDTYNQLHSQLKCISENKQLQHTLDLIHFFSYDGINNYQENPSQYIQEQLQQERLTISCEQGPLYYMRHFLSVCSQLASILFRQDPYPSYDLSYAIPINKRNRDNQTMLMWAVLLNQKEQVNYLLERGAHVNARDCSKRTSLFYAAQLGLTQIVRLLLAKGAYVSLRDSNGKTPLDYAVEQGNISTAFLLIIALKEQDTLYHLKHEVRTLEKAPFTDSQSLTPLKDLCEKYSFDYSLPNTADFC